ncbi:MAG: GAF domain-containing protein [candidate division NC10 bacterium]|nr:GAF domain-containing protein [candidate division NC10 bacterium]
MANSDAWVESGGRAGEPVPGGHEVSAEIGRALSSSLHPDQVLQSIVEHARRLLLCDVANVGIYDPVEGVLRSRAIIGHRDPGSEELVVRPGQGISGLVLQTGEPFATDDYLNDPRFSHAFDDWARAEGTVTELVVPVKRDDKVVGVLWAVNRSPRPFTARDRDLLVQLASHAAIALENARLYQQERDHVARLRALVEVSETINSQVASLDVLQVVIDRAVAGMDADEGILYLYHEAQECLQAAVVCGIAPALIPEMRFRIGESLTGRAALWRRPVLCADVLADPDLEPNLDLARRDGCRGILTLPLLREDRLIGALSFIHTHPHRFSPAEVEMATLLAGHAAIALENARLYKTIRRELTERQHAEEALRQTERRYRNLFEDAPVMYVVTGEREGDPIILDCNALFLRTVGYTRAEVLGRPLAAFYTPASRHHLLEGGGYQQALKGEFTAAERQLVTRGGQIIETLLQALPAVDAEGRVTGTHAMYVDITERKRSAEALAERTRRLEAVRAVTEEITRELDFATLLGLINQGAAQLVGAVSGTVFLWDEGARVLIPQAWYGMGEWQREVRLRLGEAVVGTVAQRREGLIVNDYRISPDAHPLTLERTAIAAVLAEPLLYHDRLVGVIAVHHEEAGQAFTPQDRETLALFASQAAAAIENARLYREGAERAARLERSLRELQALQGQLVRTEKLRALGEMASGVAHDFNNLLGIVLARAQFLSSLVDDPQVRSGLAVIEKAALDGAVTVRRLQEFTRPRGGEEAFEPVPVAELIEDVLNLTQGRWKREAERQGMRYRIHRALAPVPPVLGDAAELREALTNLILNALDAMPAGGELTVEAQAVAGRQLLLLPHAPGGASTPEVEAVEIRIRDTGSGMTEDVQRRVFDPFFTTKGARGTGLGLSVVYGIVTRHGGEVLLDSAPGRGTTVSLRLPAASEVPRRAAAPVAPAAVAIPGTRVLVIDDEVDIREVIADVLGRAGYTVEVAADGHQGLEKFGSGQFDLVITDLGMPHASGWKVADAVKARSPGTPVVLITGWGATVSEEQLAAHQIDRLLAKPFRLEDLAASVTEAVTRARNRAGR